MRRVRDRTRSRQWRAATLASAGWRIIEKDILINGLPRKITGDAGYLSGPWTAYEPSTVAVLAALCDADSRVLDIGANIGLTSLALSALCPGGKIAAIEPGASAFRYLQANLRANTVTNVRAFNCAAGPENGFVALYVDEDNLASAFVVESGQAPIDASTAAPMRRIDDALVDFGLDRVDVIKIDVEGFELDVLDGAQATLARFAPRVYMEMNHWCLNAFRRVALPDFYDRVCAIFPVVYAIHGTSYLDFRVPANRDRIYHEHIVLQKWSNLVCGFDGEAIEGRLARIEQAEDDGVARANSGDLGRLAAENATLVSECQNLRQSLMAATRQVDAYRNSTIWRLTGPLRAVIGAFR